MDKNNMNDDVDDHHVDDDDDDDDDDVKEEERKLMSEQEQGSRECNSGLSLMEKNKHQHARRNKNTDSYSDSHSYSHSYSYSYSDSDCDSDCDSVPMNTFSLRNLNNHLKKLSMNTMNTMKSLGRSLNNLSLGGNCLSGGGTSVASDSATNGNVNVNVNGNGNSSRCRQLMVGFCSVALLLFIHNLFLLPRVDQFCFICETDISFETRTRRIYLLYDPLTYVSLSHYGDTSSVDVNGIANTNNTSNTYNTNSASASSARSTRSKQYQNTKGNVKPTGREGDIVRHNDLRAHSMNLTALVEKSRLSQALSTVDFKWEDLPFPGPVHGDRSYRSKAKRGRQKSRLQGHATSKQDGCVLLAFAEGYSIDKLDGLLTSFGSYAGERDYLVVLTDLTLEEYTAYAAASSSSSLKDSTSSKESTSNGLRSPEGRSERETTTRTWNGKERETDFNAVEFVHPELYREDLNKQEMALHPKFQRYVVMNEWLKAHGHRFKYAVSVDSRDTVIQDSLFDMLERENLSGLFSTFEYHQFQPGKVNYRWIQKITGSTPIANYITSLTLDGAPVPIICSGVYGGSAQAMYHYSQVMRRVIGLLPWLYQGDQGLHNIMQYVGLPLMKFPHRILVTNPSKGPITHAVVSTNQHLNVTASTSDSRLLVDGQPYAIVHQYDRVDFVKKAVHDMLFKLKGGENEDSGEHGEGEE